MYTESEIDTEKSERDTEKSWGAVVHILNSRQHSRTCKYSSAAAAYASFITKILILGVTGKNTCGIPVAQQRS